MAGAVAVPKEDRWHRGRIPLLGGVAIVGAVLTVAVLLPPLPTQAWTLLGGAAALAVVGLIDDLRPLPPQAKFLLQLVITSVLVAAGLRLTRTGYSAVDQIITLVWLVGVSNAFNLLDNMDGLAAGIGLIAAAFRCYFFLVDGNIEGAVAGRGAGRGAGRLPALQLPTGLGLHGRHRQSLHRPDGRRAQRDGRLALQPRHRRGPAAAGAAPARAALRHGLRDRRPHHGRTLGGAGRARSHVAPAGGAGDVGAGRGAGAVCHGAGLRRRRRAVVPLRAAVHRDAGRPAGRRPRRARRQARPPARVSGAQHQLRHGPGARRLQVQEAGRHGGDRRRPGRDRLLLGLRAALRGRARRQPADVCQLAADRPALPRADARRLQDLPGLVAARRAARSAEPARRRHRRGRAVGAGGARLVPLRELFARRLRDPLAAPGHLPDRQPGAVPRPGRALPRRVAQRPARRSSTGPARAA